MEITQEKLIQYVGIGQVLLITLFYIYFGRHLGHDIPFISLLITSTLFAESIKLSHLPVYWNKILLVVSVGFYLYFIVATFVNFGDLIGRVVYGLLFLFSLAYAIYFWHTQKKYEKENGIVKPKPKVKIF
ncbi:hypothetical protein MmiAt1_07270 [Methanimicrococcus sp. At1]|uniref:Uncharacterized protein n=1 Tax=Methanimicrococcus hacksteinii TaxID=3028293 RepID=A0ABU3VP28_9EURY|nr:hypothetical protein [Methanimicrococcus sp. At1]MDV0445170.1 hypothetical protein [Methanimicrococcus sp. At1]